MIASALGWDVELESYNGFFGRLSAVGWWLNCGVLHHFVPGDDLTACRPTLRSPSLTRRATLATTRSTLCGANTTVNTADANGVLRRVDRDLSAQERHVPGD
uniref:(northern house mosquito) hypothetical protein n=1 Tax=Culex pipiens TaxID=7175 RepID=A0A8D8KQK6_CULPI